MSPNSLETYLESDVKVIALCRVMSEAKLLW